MIKIEENEFGKDLGIKTLYQLSLPEFQLVCSSPYSVSSNTDATGRRLYSGAHVAIRCLHTLCLSGLLRGKTVIEIGCGIGGMGFVGASHGQYKMLVLTDGDDEALETASKNYHHLYNPYDCDNIQISKLVWGDQISLNNLLKKINDDQPFDVVIGCELMYYSTDINLLLSTVKSLCHVNNGIFIHGHLFRRDGQIEEFIDESHAIGWNSLEIPCHEFLSDDELTQHPEWYRVRMLISAPINTINNLLCKNSNWILFQPEQIEVCDDNDQGDNDNEINCLGRLFK
eukprot:gene7039-9611_t